MNRLLLLLLLAPAFAALPARSQAPERQWRFEHRPGTPQQAYALNLVAACSTAAPDALLPH